MKCFEGITFEVSGEMSEKNLDESSMGVSVRFLGKFSGDILGEIPGTIHEEFLAENIAIIIGKKSGGIFRLVLEETRCEISEEIS